MKGARALHSTGVAPILTRLLLAFALLFADLLSDIGAARAAPSPSNATHLITGAGPAIVPPDAARILAGLSHDDHTGTDWSPVVQFVPLPAQTIKGQPAAPSICRPARTHLRPFPHGPPLV